MSVQPLSVFELCPDNERVHTLAFSGPTPSGIFHRFDGTPLAANWESLAVDVAEADDELGALGDHMLLGTIPTFSDRAASALGSLLTSAGELLPLEFSRGRYYAFNVTRVLPALDQAKSQIRRFADGSVLTVEKFAFVPKLIAAAPVFKLVELPRAYVFVTDVFVRRVETAALTGFLFRHVWSSS